MASTYISFISWRVLNTVFKFILPFGLSTCSSLSLKHIILRTCTLMLLCLLESGVRLKWFYMVLAYLDGGLDIPTMEFIKHAKGLCLDWWIELKTHQDRIGCTCIELVLTILKGGVLVAIERSVIIQCHVTLLV